MARTRGARLRRGGQAPDHARHLRAQRGYYDAYYKKAQQVRTLVAQDFSAAFAEVDVIVSADLADDGVSRRREWTIRCRCT